MADLDAEMNLVRQLACRAAGTILEDAAETMRVRWGLQASELCHQLRSGAAALKAVASEPIQQDAATDRDPPTSEQHECFLYG